MTLTSRGQQYAQHKEPAQGGIQLTYRGQHSDQHKSAVAGNHIVGIYRGACLAK